MRRRGRRGSGEWGGDIALSIRLRDLGEFRELSQWGASAENEFEAL